MKPIYIGWFENTMNYGLVRCSKRVVGHFLAENVPSGSYYVTDTSFTVVRYALLAELMRRKKAFEDSVAQMRLLRVVDCKTFKLDTLIEEV